MNMNEIREGLTGIQESITKAQDFLTRVQLGLSHCCGETRGEEDTCEICNGTCKEEL